VTDWWTWGTLTGVLVRRVPAAVVNVSTRGCLIHTATPMAPGDVGLLEVETADCASPEAFRVCHARERPGAALPFSAGAEFLVLDAAPLASIRDQAARLASGQRASRLAPGKENSGRTRDKIESDPSLPRARNSGDSGQSGGDLSKMSN
jgi:hypothetical protein